jgi:2-polyprenyl-3-methyl-5-hydroxy-6-metoxy-1,4-benzoquinol methylase
MKDSLWRQPYLIELTYADNFRLVENSIRGRNLRILEVGCGTGFMSLELARMGHDVVGIDSNQWSDSPGTYDVVLFSPHPP